MSSHLVNLSWNRSTEDFNYKTFNRTHAVVFPGGETIDVTSAPEFLGDPKLTNPEELFVTALSSCFMLTFLSITANKGYIVNRYVDQAEGLLTKNAEGKMAMTEVSLHPSIVFQEDKAPDNTTLNELLDKAHANCFIANSVKTSVRIKLTYPEII